MAERGFYKNDYVRSKKVRIGWRTRDSLGQKKFDPVEQVLVVLEPDRAEIRVYVDDGKLMVMATHGVLSVRPYSGNLVQIEVNSRW